MIDIKNSNAPITDKQKKFLRTLIWRKYKNEIHIKQTLISKLERMRMGEASSAIERLLSR